MKKKALKKYINDNGFFLHVHGERIEKDAIKYEENAIKTGVKAPEGENIIFFKGTATQQFEKGEVSRNGYRIEVKGWNWKNYKNNPIILWQHNHEKPIGKVMEILPHEDGVDIVYYVDLKALNAEDAHRVESGLVPMLSTGHITIEAMFENKDTGKMIPEEDFWDIPWEERGNYNYVITKAEALEISAVTIGSNPKALTVQNALESYFNNLSMKHEKKDTEKKPAENADGTKVVEVSKNDADKPAEKAVEEKPEKEVETPAKAEVEKKDEPAKEEKVEEKVEEKKEVEDENKIEISKEDHAILKDKSDALLKALSNTVIIPEKVEKTAKSEQEMMPETNAVVIKMAEVMVDLTKSITAQNVAIEGIQKKMDNIPEKKVLAVNSQFNNLEDKEKENKKDPKKPSVKPIVDFLKSNGVRVQ